MVYVFHSRILEVAIQDTLDDKVNKDVFQRKSELANINLCNIIC